jgi:FMN phosphatase YigB (HAD superfamily)
MNQGKFAQITWVVFEAAGPLIWREPDERGMFKIRCARAGLGLMPDQARAAWARTQEWSLGQELREWQGAPALDDRVFQFAQDRAALRGFLPPEKLEAALLRLAQAPVPRTTWRVDRRAFRVLDDLRAARLRAGVVSHFVPGVADLLAKAGLPEEVEVLAAAEEADSPGARQALIRRALQGAGSAPDETLYVGTHPIGLSAATAAGTLTAWFDREERGAWPRQLPPPDVVIPQLSDLGPLLGLGTRRPASR